MIDRLDRQDSPEEIKSREVVIDRLDRQDSPEEIKSREVVIDRLDRQESPEEIKSREVVLGSIGWTSYCFSCCSTAVPRTLSR